MTKQMSKVADISDTRSKTFDYDLVGKSIDKASPHRLVFALPFVAWIGEKAGISHASGYI
jgi:hypothetical protein